MIVPRAAPPSADVPMLSLMTSIPGAITALTARAYSFPAAIPLSDSFRDGLAVAKGAGAGSYT